MIEPKNTRDIALQPHTIADAELEKLQHESFSYFLHETNPANGLVIDKNAVDWPASIAVGGLPGSCRTGVYVARRSDRTNADHVALFLEQPPRSRARRHRLPGLLLSFS